MRREWAAVLKDISILTKRFSTWWHLRILYFSWDNWNLWPNLNWYFGKFSELILVSKIFLKLLFELRTCNSNISIFIIKGVSFIEINHQREWKSENDSNKSISVFRITENAENHSGIGGCFQDHLKMLKYFFSSIIS